MICLQFSTEAALSSALIRAFDHCPWSHVDCVLPDGRLLGARGDVCAGIPPGVQVRPPGYARFSRSMHVLLPADDAMAEAHLAFLHSQVGRPYDVTAIAGFAFGRDWRDPGHWCCSELEAAALERCGWFPWRLANPSNRIDPGDLVLAISARLDLSDAAA